MHPTFEPLSGRDGLRIVDPIENVRFALFTGGAVKPTVADPEEFYFPVDAAVSFETSEIEFPKLAGIYVRTQDGDIVEDYAAAREEVSVPPGSYNVELTATPMKLYLGVESGITIQKDDTSITFAFDGEVTVRVGARSHHDSPVGTITVTDDPVDAMRAVSLLGSALKTTTCERSFPTLRGHPPLIERGDTFEIPDTIDPPVTGVRLVLPPEQEYIYPAASLAYYLGAEVVRGDKPRLVADDFEYALDRDHEYETTVNRVLQQVFFLDCLTRTEGYYQVDLYEREQVEPLVELDFADLYGRSLPGQLEAYLSVSFETLEPYAPDWSLTTDVIPNAQNVEVLPFVASDLALVRCPSRPTARTVRSKPRPLSEFYRSDFTRGAASESSDDIVQPEPVETVEHAWVGDGYPLGGNKATTDSYRRRVERGPPEKDDIEIRVVCNDERMKEEDVVNELYGVRDMLEYDVDIAYGLTAGELRELFQSPIDFLHYIGHVDEQGIRCSDGYLDAKTLDSVSVKAFLLNACRSYTQGMALIERGSRGGVVTLSEIANVSATKVGCSLARLLNAGFPLRTGLEIAKEEILTGYRYMTVGDGGLSLVQSESGMPLAAKVERRGDDEYHLTTKTYVRSDRFGIGSMHSPNVSESPMQYLVSGEDEVFEVSGAELLDFLTLEVMPVEMDGEIYWTDEISAAIL